LRADNHGLSLGQRTFYQHRETGLQGVEVQSGAGLDRQIQQERQVDELLDCLEWEQRQPGLNE